MLLPYPDAEQLYRRMVFNVLARNCDDHTKNFSFLMDKNGKWRLAPAFDVCHSYRPDSTWVSQHSMSINGKRQNITRNDLLQVAKQMNIKKANLIIDKVQHAISKWSEYALVTNVNLELKEAIERTLLKL
jgi:serine/threonine-protein kinase HipA